MCKKQINCRPYKDPIKAINHISKACAIIGLLCIFNSFFLKYSGGLKIWMCISGLVYISLGLALKKSKNTVIAIILLVLSATGVVFNIINLFGIFSNTHNRSIPIMGIAMIVASIQAIDATYKYSENNIE